MSASITINIVSYRYGHLVAHCLESVLGQTVKPDVIRVYDDGVGDCRHIKQLYPEVEFIERKGNLGIIANFNQALEQNQHELTGCMAMRALLDKEWQELQDERMAIIQQLQGR